MAKKPATLMDRLRTELHTANLTHVAKAAGMSVMQVRKIRDRVTLDPRISTVEKIAKFLGVPMR